METNIFFYYFTGTVRAHSLILISSCDSLGFLLQNGSNKSQQTSTTLPLTQYPTIIVQMMISYLYTGVMEKPDDKYTELFDQLMAEYELMPDDTISLDRTTSSEQLDTEGHVPQTLDVNEKVPEMTKPLDSNQSSRIKQEIDTEYTTKLHAINDAHDDDNDDMNDNLSTSQRKAERNDDLNMSDSKSVEKKDPLTDMKALYTAKGNRTKRTYDEVQNVIHKAMDYLNSTPKVIKKKKRRRMLTTERKVHKCPICGRICTCPSELTKHIRVHTGERPISCPVCSQRFKQKSHLTDHMRVHSTGMLGHSKFFLCFALHLPGTT